MAVDAAALLDLAASLPDSGEREYRDGATIFTFRGRGIGYVSADGRHLFVKSTLEERDAMINSRPEVYQEWYTSGRFGWVRVRLDLIDIDEAGELVARGVPPDRPEEGGPGVRRGPGLNSNGLNGGRTRWDPCRRGGRSTRLFSRLSRARSSQQGSVRRR